MDELLADFVAWLVRFCVVSAVVMLTLSWVVNRVFRKRGSADAKPTASGR